MRCSTKLPNYLRTYRKRATLSQQEITFLLGAKSGSKISRYERFARQPGLATAFAYEVIFRTPARELFSGLFTQARDEVLAQAKVLMRQLAQEKSGAGAQRKLDLLKLITTPATPSGGDAP